MLVSHVTELLLTKSAMLDLWKYADQTHRLVKMKFASTTERNKFSRGANKSMLAETTRSRTHVKLSYQHSVMVTKKMTYADVVVPAICVTKPNVLAARDATSTKPILLLSWTLQALSKSRTSTP